MTITLTDQIPSGKNAMGVRRDGRHYPNPRFEKWRVDAAYDLILQKAKWPITIMRSLPLKGPLTMTISYRELVKVPANGVRDLPGMADALFHFLVHMHMIVDDGQIKGLTWAYPWRTEGPCIQMTLEEAT